MQQAREIPNNVASLLANNMAGLTTQLDLAYRQFVTRAISKDAFRAKILEILNGNYDQTLVEPIINELELRHQLWDQTTITLDGEDFTGLKADQLVLDANNHISVPETIRHYFHGRLQQQKSAQLHDCAIYGLTEFISAQNYEIFAQIFFGDAKRRNQGLEVMFYLSALHGNLAFLQRVWELAESFGVEKSLITSHNFRVVAAGRASNNPQINDFVMGCAKKAEVTAEIPEYSEDQMFPLFVRANNRSGLLACWKHARTPAEYLSLLTDNDCAVFDSIEGVGQEETRETLLNCLIALNNTGKVQISAQIWKTYFEIAVNKCSISSVVKIWQAVEDEPLKKSLLDHVIYKACDEAHLPVMKFILEQAEVFAENPIDPEKIELIESTIPNGLIQIGELFTNSPLLQSYHQLKK